MYDSDLTLYLPACDFRLLMIWSTLLLYSLLITCDGFLFWTLGSTTGNTQWGLLNKFLINSQDICSLFPISIDWMIIEGKQRKKGTEETGCHSTTTICPGKVASFLEGIWLILKGKKCRSNVTLSKEEKDEGGNSMLSRVTGSPMMLAHRYYFSVFMEKNL